MTAVAAPPRPTGRAPVQLPPSGAIRRLADALAGVGVVADLYDEGAATYESLVDHDNSEIGTMVIRSRGLRGDVLDLGCGGGRLTLPFLARGHRVLAVDLSASMLAQLAARATALPQRLAERLEIRRADMSTLSVLGRRFDVILLGTTTVTLLDAAARGRTFDAVRRHLAPGGRFFVSTVWFDRRPEQGPPPETAQVFPVAGADGTMLMTLLEQVADDLSHRWVGVLATGPVARPGRPSLFVSRPATLAEPVLHAELAAAGLRVTHTDPLATGADGRRITLLTCVGEGS